MGVWTGLRDCRERWCGVMDRDAIKRRIKEKETEIDIYLHQPSRAVKELDDYRLKLEEMEDKVD